MKIWVAIVGQVRDEKTYLVLGRFMQHGNPIEKLDEN